MQEVAAYQGGRFLKINLNQSLGLTETNFRSKLSSLISTLPDIYIWFYFLKVFQDTLPKSKHA